MRRVIVYGLAGSVLLALLKLLEYKHFVRAYPTEIYGGLVVSGAKITRMEDDRRGTATLRCGPT